jgi:hypothetical protein
MPVNPWLVAKNHTMTTRKIIVLIISFALAYMLGEGLFPTPNVVGGGAAKMSVLIFLTIIFKATIEFWLRGRKAKRDKKQFNEPAP